MRLVLLFVVVMGMFALGQLTIHNCDSDSELANAPNGFCCVDKVGGTVDDDLETPEGYASFIKTFLFAYISNPEEFSDVNEDQFRLFVDVFMNHPGDLYDDQQPRDEDVTSIDGDPADNPRFIRCTTLWQLYNAHSNGDQFSDVVDRIKNRIANIEEELGDTIIPNCNDGTPYGQCSDNKPLFCLSGKLVHMCAGFDGEYDGDDWEDNFASGNFQEEVNFDNCGCPEPYDALDDFEAFCHAIGFGAGGNPDDFTGYCPVCSDNTHCQTIYPTTAPNNVYFCKNNKVVHRQFTPTCHLPPGKTVGWCEPNPVDNENFRDCKTYLGDNSAFCYDGDVPESERGNPDSTPARCRLPTP